MSQPITSATTNDVHSLIDRVLDLRRQLGIDVPLSVDEAEDALSSPGKHELSMETPKHTPSTNSRDWLCWSQSPGEGKWPEKG